MPDIIERIQNAGKDEIDDILQAAMARYRELYPQWQINTISLEKAVDKNEQLDRIISLLEKMKEK